MRMRPSVLLVLLAACVSPSPEAESEAPTASAHGALPRSSDAAVPVRTATVRQGDLLLWARVTGTVRADAVVTVRAEVAGVLMDVARRPGDPVRRGATVAQVDPTLFDLAEAEARVAVEEAEQRLRESVVPESVVTGHGPTLTQRQAQVMRSGLRTAQLRLARVQWEQARTRVLAPLTGVVDAVYVSTGEQVVSGQPLLSVADTQHLHIEAPVLEQDLPRLRVGHVARITVSGLAGRVLSGRITAVLPVVDTVTRAGRVLVRIDDAVPGDGGAAGRVFPGMSVDVALETERVSGRVLVPARAVIERDGRTLVFVVRDGRARWTYVTPGRSNGEFTEVLHDPETQAVPLSPGDQVITEGQFTLTHDAPVRSEAERVPRVATPRRRRLTGQPSGSAARPA